MSLNGPLSPIEIKRLFSAAPALRVKVLLGTKKKSVFKGGDSLRVILFSKDIDELQSRAKNRVPLYGRSICPEKKIGQDDAARLNRILAEIHSKKRAIAPNRLLALMYSVYLLGVYISKPDSLLFSNSDQGRPRRVKLDDRDFLIDASLGIPLNDIIALFEKTPELFHKSLEWRAIKQSFPPRTVGKGTLSIAWVKSIVAAQESKSSSITVQPAPDSVSNETTAPVVRQPGKCYLSLNNEVLEVNPRVYRFVVFLRQQGITNAALAEGQDALLVRAGLGGGRVSDLWKIKHPTKNYPSPAPVLKKIFLTAGGKYYLNPSVEPLALV